MKKKLIVICSSLILSVPALANNNTGCGLGSVLIKKQDTVALQWVAMWLNGLYSNQMLGITSGFFDCEKPSKIVSNKVKIFVADNMDSLALDISNGQGTTLSTLASLLKIKDTVAFGKKLQTNFSSIYSNENISSAQVIDSVILLGN